MEEEKAVVFPETYTRRRLNTLYRQIPLEDAIFRRLRKYFSAMANLYGSIPLDKAKEIVLSLEPSLVSEDEFWAFVQVARHECEGYLILGKDELFSDIAYTPPQKREIVSVDLLDDDLEPYLTLEAMQGDKPYHVPDKKRMLAYQDPFYAEDTPEKAALFAFLREHTGADEEPAQAALEVLLLAARSPGGETMDGFSCLEEMGIRLTSQRDAERFMELYGAFWNTTRMPVNRGYTPKELVRRMPERGEGGPESVTLGPNVRRLLRSGEMDINELRGGLLTAQLPEQVRMDLLRELREIERADAPPDKVGRNDPCPCGSGKKFKKCCGR